MDKYKCHICLKIYKDEDWIDTYDQGIIYKECPNCGELYNSFFYGREKICDNK